MQRRLPVAFERRVADGNRALVVLRPHLRMQVGQECAVVDLWMRRHGLSVAGEFPAAGSVEVQVCERRPS